MHNAEDFIYGFLLNLLEDVLKILSVIYGFLFNLLKDFLKILTNLNMTFKLFK